MFRFKGDCHGVSTKLDQAEGALSKGSENHRLKKDNKWILITNVIGVSYFLKNSKKARNQPYHYCQEAFEQFKLLKVLDIICSNTNKKALTTRLFLILIQTEINTASFSSVVHHHHLNHCVHDMTLVA